VSSLHDLYVIPLSARRLLHAFVEQWIEYDLAGRLNPYGFCDNDSLILVDNQISYLFL
jgi:hypothetical protein